MFDISSTYESGQVRDESKVENNLQNSTATGEDHENFPDGANPLVAQW